MDNHGEAVELFRRQLFQVLGDFSDECRVFSICGEKLGGCQRKVFTDIEKYCQGRKCLLVLNVIDVA